MNSENQPKNSFNLFVDESTKLKNSISKVQNSKSLSSTEIVGLYYQVINVSSLAEFFKKSTGGSEATQLNKIQEIEKYIEENFNQSLHPLVSTQLKNHIENTKEKLKGNQTKQRSQSEIENQAKLYEQLRQEMSTKEFVEQYNQVLKKS